MNLGSQHLSHRRRQEPFPARTALKRALDYLMYGVSVVQPFALVPQILSIYADHNTAGISILTWLLLTVCNILWALYGLAHRDRAIVLVNALLVIGDIAIVYGALTR